MASNAPNKDELLRMGINAAKSGQEQAAQMMLRQVLRQDSRNVQALLWLAKIAESQDMRAQWLERVLKIDPNNAVARKALDAMNNSDEAKRNRMYLQVGVVAYILLVLVLALLSIFLFT